MKLFTRYARVNFLATILVLIVGSFCYFFIIRFVLIRQLDDALKIEEAEILDYVAQKGKLPEPTNYKDQMIVFGPAEKGLKRQFRSTYQDPEGNRGHEPFRQLEFPIEAGGVRFSVTVSKSQVETEDLLWLIVAITVGVIILLLLIQFLLNRYLLQRIWTPFYGTLGAIQKFNLQSRSPLQRHPSDIDEFSSLDLAVNQMTDKIIGDYQALKDFADNASHEMQTPLAVINSKLDLLLQERDITELQGRHLQAMYDAVGRMSRLNQSLLLLTKIGNDQFGRGASVALHDLVREKVAQLEEMAVAHKLQFTTHVEEATVNMDPYLADILLNNLFSNSIRHNTEGGSVRVDLRQGTLEVANTGEPLPFEADRIFDRFAKGKHSESTGLGLAIVRQICEVHGCTISYRWTGIEHLFTLVF